MHLVHFLYLDVEKLPGEFGEIVFLGIGSPATF